MFKSIVLILLFLIIYAEIYGQKKYKYNYEQGYKFIKKAESNFEKGDLKSAKEFLEKAKKAHYGFCGNARMSAFAEINYIDTKIFMKKEQFDSALKVLDSTDAYGFGDNLFSRDSLKMLCLFGKFGKDLVVKAFSESRSMRLTAGNYFTEYCLYLNSLKYNFCFAIDYRDRPKEVEFHALAKDKPFYKLLK